MKLTSRQKEVFSFIEKFIEEHGYPPSVREIASGFNIYPRAAFDHLKALEKKGYLRRWRSMSRSLEILVFPGRNRGISKSPFIRNEPSVRDVPIVGRIAAGKPILAVEQIEGTISLPAEWARGEEVFLLKVQGDSMAPFILPDDYAIVRSQSTADNGDVVVALIDDEATVKRFFRKGKTIELKPDNQQREVIRIDEGAGNVQILGKVIGVFRKF